MRRSEITNMQWEDVYLDKHILHIPNTKNNIPRDIPLNGNASGILNSLSVSDSGKVFDIEPHSITQAFRRACKRAGIEDLRFHDLRHERVSQLFELGLNVMEVAAISGHQSLSMLKRYTHIKAESLVDKI